jgi:hypothetical protein
MFHKSLLTLLTVWTSAAMCLAQDPSFPQTSEIVQLVKNQYIVQFEGADSFEEAKISTSNDNSVEVVRHIDSRMIAVVKFADKKAATKWRDDAGGIKYFEPGEKCSAYIYI